MHPVLALASRLFNTFELPGRLTAENLSRLRFSVEAVRAYLTGQVSVGSAMRQDVLPSIERICGLGVVVLALRGSIREVGTPDVGGYVELRAREVGARCIPARLGLLDRVDAREAGEDVPLERYARAIFRRHRGERGGRRIR